MKRVRRTAQLRSTFLLLPLIVLIGLGVVAQTWWLIVQDRQLTLAADRASALQAVRLMERHTSKILDAAVGRIDTILSATKSLALPLPATEAAIIEMIEDSVKNHRMPGSFQFVTLGARRWGSSFDYPAYVIDREARPFIATLLAQPEFHQVLVAPPLRRFVDGQMVLPIARNLFDHRKRHVGMISTEIELAEFSAIYAPVVSDNKSSVQLLSDSGHLILRAAPDKGADVAEFSGNALPAAFNGSEGYVEIESPAMTGAARHYAYSRSSTHPVVIVMGRERAAIFDDWAARTHNRIAFAAAFIGLALVLIFWILRHMRESQRAERSLRDSERKFNRLFQRSPVPLALINVRRGQWIEINDAFEAQFGYSHAMLASDDPISTAIWGGPDACHTCLMQFGEQEQMDHVELQMRHLNGSWLTCMASSRMVPAEGESIAIFSPIDISRERAIEQDIRELNAQLEMRVRERTLTLERQHGELECAIEQAEQAGLAKARVLAAASHDLRQPLHALSLYSAVLSAGPAPDTLAIVASHIDLSVRALNALLNSLLDLSKLDAGVFKVDVTLFNVSAMLQRICHDYRAPAVEKHLLLQLEGEPLFVLADQVVVERIARNVIDNAIKYTDRGAVQVGVWRDEGRVYVKVCDSGRGIAEDDQQRIFEEFYQVDNPGRDRAQGLGLGLSIVARLAQLTDARLEMQSTLGRGSEFSWSMPFATGVTSLPAPTPSPAQAGLRILLVDDESMILHSMSLLLQSWQCTPYCADGLEQAQRIMYEQGGHIDLLIVDLRLRDGADGLHLASRLRTQWGDFPVLVISGETNPDKLKDAAASGYLMLHKPLAADVLHQSIEQLCRGAH